MKQFLFNFRRATDLEVGYAAVDGAVLLEDLAPHVLLEKPALRLELGRVVTTARVVDRRLTYKTQVGFHLK